MTMGYSGPGPPTGRPGPARNPDAKVKILLVDDHAMFRDRHAPDPGARAGLRDRRGGGGFPDRVRRGPGRRCRTSCCSTCRSRPRAASRRPSASSARCPSAGIIALAVEEDEDQLFDAIKAGAAAFILKDISPDDLVTIIRRVNTGEYLINDKVFSRPAVASRVLKEFRELAVYGQEAAPIFAPLSPREVEILDNIAKGMTNKQVAYALSICEQTVKNHMSSILRKLSVNDRTQAVVYAMKQGWIRHPGGLTIEPDPWRLTAAPSAQLDRRLQRRKTEVAGIRMVLASDISSLNQELDELTLLTAQAVTETERHEIAARQGGGPRGRHGAGPARGPRGAARGARPAADPEPPRGPVRGPAAGPRGQGADAACASATGSSRSTRCCRAPTRDRCGRSRRSPAHRPGSPWPTPARRGTGNWTERDRGALLRAQEELRKDIARHMHDGPAQSLANIALQAEIVQRLASRGDARVGGELASLRTMVQAALETTKEFIFDVRPMVLDDLGLVPTLRRVVVDRGRRSGIEVAFDSQGPLRRIDPDLESGLFRIIAEAATGYLDAAAEPAPGAPRLERDGAVRADPRHLDGSSSGAGRPARPATTCPTTCRRRCGP